jgi:hypothetical protein
MVEKLQAAVQAGIVSLDAKAWLRSARRKHFGEHHFLDSMLVAKK